MIVERTDTDHLNVAAWADDTSRGLLCFLRFVVFTVCGYRILGLQLLFDKFKFASLLGVVEAVGADLLKPFGQGMLQEACYELLSR